MGLDIQTPFTEVTMRVSRRGSLQLKSWTSAISSIDVTTRVRRRGSLQPYPPGDHLCNLFTHSEVGSYLTLLQPYFPANYLCNGT